MSGERDPVAGQGEHPSDELAGFALDALEPNEAAAVEAHLEECEQCRAELHWLAPAVDLIPSSVPQLDPPRSLRRSLIRTVRAEARAGRGGWWARRAGWITLRSRPAVVVGAMALLGAGVAGYAVNEANRSEPPTVTAVEAKGLGDAAAVLTRTDGEAVLHVERLPALDPGHVYQLWFRDRDGIHPRRTFVLDEENRATAPLGPLPPAATEVLVTREPEGGSERPTPPIRLKAPVG